MNLVKNIHKLFLTKIEKMIIINNLTFLALVYPIYIMPYDMHELAKKAGGTFHFTTLLIRRARELAGNAPQLIGLDSNDPAEIALEEFARGKISLADDEVKKIE
jgi:DNA-directed RNA polymerase subunit K/omega